MAKEFTHVRVRTAHAAELRRVAALLAARWERNKSKADRLRSRGPRHAGEGVSMDEAIGYLLGQFWDHVARSEKQQLGVDLAAEEIQAPPYVIGLMQDGRKPEGWYHAKIRFAADAVGYVNICVHSHPTKAEALRCGKAWVKEWQEAE